jgi:hypothetical protein
MTVVSAHMHVPVIITYSVYLANGCGHKSCYVDSRMTIREIMISIIVMMLPLVKPIQM